jgi:uncharacterized repeat protein (TIGR01451 family)
MTLTLTAIALLTLAPPPAPLPAVAAVTAPTEALAPAERHPVKPILAGRHEVLAAHAEPRGVPFAPAVRHRMALGSAERRGMALGSGERHGLALGEPPGIVVTLDNSATVAGEGAPATYRITIRNNSDVDYPGAKITQMLPAALSYETADPEPVRVSGSEISWTRHLAPHSEVAIDVRGAVSKPAGGRVTVSTTACVLPAGITEPLICDSDTDRFVPRASTAAVWWGMGGVIAALGGILAIRSRVNARKPLHPARHRG